MVKLDETFELHRFKNTHLSISRIRLFEACELAFFFRYVAPKGQTEPRDTAPDFGVVLHKALELTYDWIVAEEFSGTFPEDALLQSYDQAWIESKLVGVALYQEGKDILRRYARGQELVSHWNILAVEEEFNVEADGFVVNGFIDRIDRVDDETVLVVDYKSNRALYTKNELGTDLQMPVYGRVARELFPWAKRVQFRFEMLRHGATQSTERTEEQSKEAMSYLASIGRRTELPKADGPEGWPGTLSPNCRYCDYRRRCPVYQAAVDGGHELGRLEKKAPLDELAAQFEKVNRLSKLLYARKAELQKVLEKKLAEEGEFDAGGYHYRHVSGGHEKRFRLPLLRSVLDDVNIPNFLDQLMISGSDVERLCADLEGQLPRATLHILRASLDAVALSEPKTPRFDSKKTAGAERATSDEG